MFIFKWMSRSQTFFATQNGRNLLERERLAAELGVGGGWSTFRGEPAFPGQPPCKAGLCPSLFAL